MESKPDIRSLWNFNDPAGSEARFKEFLPHARATDRDYWCELLTQIARAQGLQRKFDEAFDTLKDAKEVLDENCPIAHIRYHLELGRAENSSGQKEPAKLRFAEALRLANEADEEYLAVDAAHMLGIVYTGQEGLDWNLKAIDMAESAKSEEARSWLGSLYNNTGWTLHDMGELNKAHDIFKKALDLRLAQGNPENIRIAKWCLARCKRSLGQIDEALATQRELEDGDPMGYAHEEIAECLLLKGEINDSKPYFKKAHEMLSKDPWLQANEKERLERLQQLSQ